MCASERARRSSAGVKERGVFVDVGPQNCKKSDFGRGFGLGVLLPCTCVRFLFKEIVAICLGLLFFCFCVCLFGI